MFFSVHATQNIAAITDTKIYFLALCVQIIQQGFYITFYFIKTGSTFNIYLLNIEEKVGDQDQ